MKMKNLGLLATLILIASPVTYGADDIRSLENLERQRARLIELALTPDLGNVKRQSQLQQMSHNMVDLERMVLRDDRLLGLTNPAVKRAFNNYDLTFLCHASMESSQHIVDFWLEKQGLSTQELSKARVGLR